MRIIEKNSICLVAMILLLFFAASQPLAANDQAMHPDYCKKSIENQAKGDRQWAKGERSEEREKR